MKKKKKRKIRIYVWERPYVSITYAKTNAADLDIPAFPWTKTWPPEFKPSSIKAFTFGKCWIIFSVAVSAIFKTRYL